MKIYGYKIEEANGGVFPYELAEITLSATPTELRDIARFLVGTAENMEKMGKKYSHEHLSDKIKAFENSPHFVVFPSESK